MKILVVEDDAATAEYVARGLTEAGHLVDRAADGREGLVLASDGGYDALLLAAPVHVASVRRYFVDTMDGDQLSIVGDGMRRVHEQVGGERG